MARLSTIVGTLGAAFVIGGVGGAWMTLSSSGTTQAGKAYDDSTAEETAAPSPGLKSANPSPAPSSSQARAQKQADGRIVISGVFPGAHAGDEVTVQRRQGGQWEDFPASTHTETGGRYSLWVRTEHASAFRVRDEQTGAVSAPTSASG
jgi:hypothetical protein